MKKPTIMPRIVTLLLTVILLSLTACAQAGHEQADLNPNDPSTYSQSHTEADVGKADDNGTPGVLPKAPKPQKSTTAQGSIVGDNSHAIDAEPFRITLERRFPLLLNYGIEITARDGAIYYERPDQGGSGRHGTANNLYTEKMYIAGFAIVERSSGRLIMSQCFDRAHVPSYRPAPARFREYDSLNADLLVAACTDGFTTGEIGWFRAEDLTEYLPNNNTNDPSPRDGSGPKEPSSYPEPKDPDAYHTDLPKLPEPSTAGGIKSPNSTPNDQIPAESEPGYGLPEPLPESHADHSNTNQSYATNSIIYYR